MGDILREIIQEKLDRMTDLQQRRILKNMMWDVFKEIIDHQDNVNKELEDRLFNEVKNREDTFVIYNTIVHRERLPLVSDFLFPMREEDYDEKLYQKKDIIDGLKNNQEVVITQIFLKRDAQEIRNIRLEEKIYGGVIISEERRIPISVVLKYNEKYLAIEEEMYRIFMQNAIKWTSINNPYIRKFFDVVIIGCEENIDDLRDFEEIVFDLEELEEDKFVDYVPVWNIQKSNVKGEGFPLPADDKVNYEHVIPYDTMGVDNGYLLAPNQNMVSLRKTEEGLIITSKESNSTEWELYTILQENKLLVNDRYEFDLLSNKRKEAFVSSFFNRTNKVIRSYSELNRLANSFEAASGVKIKGIEVLDYVPEGTQTYDFNSYIVDEIRANRFRKGLVIRFASIEEGYLIYDIVSFIVSEIQQYFPEYICKGVIN